MVFPKDFFFNNVFHTFADDKNSPWQEIFVLYAYGSYDGRRNENGLKFLHHIVSFLQLHMVLGGVGQGRGSEKSLK